MASSSTWTANAAKSRRRTEVDDRPNRRQPVQQRLDQHEQRRRDQRIAIAKITMSPRVLPRATKNSGESASTSNSGLANAKDQSTAR